LKEEEEKERKNKIVDMIFLYIDGLVSPLRVQYPLLDARQVEATNRIQHAAECMMQAGRCGRGA